MALAIAARLAVWFLVYRLVADSEPTALDAVVSAIGSVVGRFAEGLQTVIVAVAGAVLLGGAIALLLGRPGDRAGTADPERSTLTTGSSIGPIAGSLARVALRAGISLAGIAVWAALAALAWTASGFDGVRVAIGVTGPTSRFDLVVAAAAMRIRQVGISLGLRLSERSAQWGHREHHGVWLFPVAIERGQAGELLEATTWPPGRDEPGDAAELRELANSVIAAYDVALTTGAGRAKGPEGGADPRLAAPRPYPYRIEAVRAWTRPGFHGVVVRAIPASASALLAKVTTDQLRPTIDAETSWTATELRGLHLSDPRVAKDPLRGGEPGVFVALDRRDPDTAEALGHVADAGEAAIERALREADLGGRFRLVTKDVGFDADTYEYRASFASSAEWRELESAWKGLTPAVALFAREPAVRLETKLDPYAFVAVIPKPTPEFPAGESTDWARVVHRYEPILRRRPLSFVLGLDHQSQPLIVGLGTETPHLLIAGSTGSGKSRSAVFSPLAQLIRLHEPSRLRLWLLDSVKREATTLFGDAPHVERSVIAEDGDHVVALLEAFTGSMDARYRQQAGREFDPRHGDAKVLLIEEWADLRDLLDKEQLERVIRAVNRVGQLGRAAGHHVILVTQKASAEVIPPRLKTNFKGRIAGYLPQASDYGIMFDQHRRLLPNVKGRMAVSLGDDSIRVVQGLYIDNTIVREIVGASGSRSEGPAPAALMAPGPVPEPRAPTAREVEDLDLLTLTRLIYRWQATSDESVTVSVRALIDQVRSLGYVPGRVERYTAGPSDVWIRDRTQLGPGHLGLVDLVVGAVDLDLELRFLGLVVGHESPPLGRATTIP